MKFTKCHGLGNDYIYVQAKDLSLEEAVRLAPEWTNRRTGIGGDGIILIDQVGANHLSMRIVNQDGSEAETCGNGLRSVVHLGHINGWLTDQSCVVDTQCGQVSATLESVEGNLAQVTVAMGHAEMGDSFELEGPEGKWTWQCVSMGNPHAVCLLPAALSEDDFLSWGPKVSRDPAFAGELNANFLSREGEALRSRIWERGSGATLACGSGACAGFAVARQAQWCGDTAEIKLPLGSLHISFDTGKGILMTGPSEVVFSGQV